MPLLLAVEEEAYEAPQAQAPEDEAALQVIFLAEEAPAAHPGFLAEEGWGVRVSWGGFRDC